MDDTVGPDKPSQTSDTRDVRCATVVHAGHAWRFVWRSGAEARVMRDVIERARAGAPGLDQPGVARIANQVFHQLSADQQAFLCRLAAQPPPEPGSASDGASC